MQTVLNDLWVTLEDRPGTLAKATEAIAKAGINIEGFASLPCGGEATFHVLTTEAPATRRALEGAGLKVRGEQQVLVMDVEDKPGALSKIARRIADHEVNVDFAYVATRSRVVIGAKDLKTVQEAVKDFEPAKARA